jgi:hypothetical protein
LICNNFVKIKLNKNLNIEVIYHLIKV